MSAKRSVAALSTLMILLATCLIVSLQAMSVYGQEGRSKLPIIGKLTSGNHQQAFTGKVQSLDLKQKILNVNSLHGRDTEIFPVKKSVHVQGADGQKMKLKELAPGMTILIYYDQKSGERTVKDIIVLSSSKSQEEGKTAHSS